MNLRNATCVGTQTSKVPTGMALLVILYTVLQWLYCLFPYSRRLVTGVSPGVFDCSNVVQPWLAGRTSKNLNFALSYRIN